MKQLVTYCAILFLVGCTTSAQGQAFDKKPFHHFDFWLGEWTVYSYSADTIVGHSRITSIIDSLGIQEFYRTPSGGYHGTSLNKYNARTKKWQQFWIDNSGISLNLQGGLVDDKMVMLDAETSVGSPMNRITWTPETSGHVRQTWDQSTDGGVSWNTIFDGKYVRK